MRKIEILDCTLRDGGYINSWNFGEDNIKQIINGLTDSKIDYVECGFFDNDLNIYNPEYSIFTKISDIENKITCYKKTRYAVMMLLHKYNIDNLPVCSSKIVDIIRLSFHKCDVNKAVNYSMKIKEKGYKLFFQPTIIMSYSDEEIINMLNICNNIIKPDVVAIVDTLGEMKTHDIQRITKIFDNNLNINTKLLFHGHNNLQMAFSNALTFIETVNEKRDIIIDSSLMGMGKDSGNVCTELISSYLNQICMGKYNYHKILSIIDSFIMDYKKYCDWGYNVKFMLNAQKSVHPSYGKFFRNNIKNLTLIELDSLLDRIPTEEKSDFNEEIAISLVYKFKRRKRI